MLVDPLIGRKQGRLLFGLLPRVYTGVMGKSYHSFLHSELKAINPQKRTLSKSSALGTNKASDWSITEELTNLVSKATNVSNSIRLRGKSILVTWMSSHKILATRSR